MTDRGHPQNNPGQYIPPSAVGVGRYDEGVSSLTGGSDRRRTPVTPEVEQW